MLHTIEDRFAALKVAALGGTVPSTYNMHLGYLGLGARERYC